MKGVDFAIATVVSYIFTFVILFALINWATSPQVSGELFSLTLLFTLVLWPVIFILVSIIAFRKIAGSEKPLMWMRVAVFSMGCALSILGTIAIGILLSDKKWI